jgi:hypothetical protein
MPNNAGGDSDNFNHEGFWLSLPRFTNATLFASRQRRDPNVRAFHCGFWATATWALCMPWVSEPGHGFPSNTVKRDAEWLTAEHASSPSRDMPARTSRPSATPLRHTFLSQRCAAAPNLAGGRPGHGSPGRRKPLRRCRMQRQSSAGPCSATEAATAATAGPLHPLRQRLLRLATQTCHSADATSAPFTQRGSNLPTSRLSARPDVLIHRNVRCAVSKGEQRLLGMRRDDNRPRHRNFSLLWCTS